MLAVVQLGGQHFPSNSLPSEAPLTSMCTVTPEEAAQNLFDALMCFQSKSLQNEMKKLIQFKGELQQMPKAGGTSFDHRAKLNIWLRAADRKHGAVRGSARSKQNTPPTFFLLAASAMTRISQITLDYNAIPISSRARACIINLTAPAGARTESQTKTRALCRFLLPALCV